MPTNGRRASRSPVRRPSISDVARRAGVSLGTVSNVLNRPERVTPGTRERVERAIADLGFVPSRAARLLRDGTPTTVGAVLLDIGNPFFTEVARGIEDRLRADDLTLMLASSDADPDREARYLRLFEEHGVLGVLVTPAGEAVEHLRALPAHGLGVVLLDHRSPYPELSSVAVDDVEGARLAVAHLLGLGHRRIGFVNGPDSIRQCVDRRAGARRAVADAGLEPGALVEVTVDALDATGGEKGAARLLGAAAAPTALFCVNDLTAMGAIRSVRGAGLEVPDDVAVVGYDDVAFAAMLATPLTSVRQPMRRMGELAADLLIRAVGPDRADPEQVEFTPELVVRASSGPPRDAR